MTAVASIVLADAQATPVNHTFIPLGPDKNGVWWYEDQSAPSTIGNNKISLAVVRPSPAGPRDSSSERMNRVKIAVHTPVLETLSNSTVSGIIPAPTVSYISRFQMEFLLPERTNLQNRQDMRAYALGILADAQVVAMVENLQSVF